MLERRRWPKITLIFLGLIVCLSIWQMTVVGPNTAPSAAYNSIPLYTLNAPNATYAYPIQQLPPSDYGTLMNLTSFYFDLLNECSSAPLLLVLIHTSPKNFLRRKSIRETWGRQTEKVKAVFMLGSVEDPRLDKKLMDEQRRHGDFVKGSFLDRYRNMTYKHVMAFKFAVYHCPRAKFILKTDDDVFVNMPTMLDFLSVELSPYGAKDLLLCRPKVKAPVLRTYGSKWRVSFKEYKEKYYPTYCPGWALLYSPDVLFRLYEDAQKSDYFWIDDVLITGILAKKANIRHTSTVPLVLTQRELNEIAQGGGSYNSSKVFLYAPPNLSIKNVYLLWHFVRHKPSRYLKSTSDCCGRSLNEAL